MGRKNKAVGQQESTHRPPSENAPIFVAKTTSTSIDPIDTRHGDLIQATLTELQKNNLNSAAFQPAIDAYFMSTGIMYKAWLAISADGLSYTDKDGKKIRNPDLITLTEAIRNVATTGSNLGLNPHGQAGTPVNAGVPDLVAFLNAVVAKEEGGGSG